MLAQDPPDQFRIPELQDALEVAGRRVREIHAIVLAIDAGELFAQLPVEPRARATHRVGIALLDIMSRELGMLIDEIDCLAMTPEAMSSIN